MFFDNAAQQFSESCLSILGGGGDEADLYGAAFSYGTNPRPTAIDARPLTIRSLIDPVPLDDLEPT